jgi:hypothetical protein
MQGAQLCLDFLGQSLFTDVTAFLYASRRQPGPIHHAVAELADPIEVWARGGWFAHWEAIITYNFNDLMGEALDSARLARCAYAVCGEEMADDPNAKRAPSVLGVCIRGSITCTATPRVTPS